LELLERYACLTVVKPEKLSQKNPDDCVISFHAWRGLLLPYLGFWVFSGPSTEDVEYISATLLHVTNLKQLLRCWGVLGIIMITEDQFKEHEKYKEALENKNNFQGSLPAEVLEKLIVLFGEANTGKTSSLKKLAIRLGMPSSGVKTNNIRVILQPMINGQEKTIFLSTFGDSVKDVMNNILFFNMKPSSNFKVYKVNGGKLEPIKEITQKPDICIGASRVEEMHWILYEQFAQTIKPKTPKPIMFRKTGTRPYPSNGTKTKDDTDCIDSILSIL
jgi:hypothetical protein